MGSKGEALGLFRQSGALLEGHFRLSSGLHSSRYLQCALVLQYPSTPPHWGVCAAALCLERAGPPESVIAPALGRAFWSLMRSPVPLAYEPVAERQEGVLMLRPGSTSRPGERCYVVEDVLTTGGSTRETMDVVDRPGGMIGVAAGAIVDRSGGRTDLGVPGAALAVLDVPDYPLDDCPMCRAGGKAVKPGSR